MDILKEQINFIKSKTDINPQVGIVLGSGLSQCADFIEVQDIIEYKDIPDFPISTVKGHKGRFIFGHAGIIPVILMQGRVHFYEGYPMKKVINPIEIMAELGINTLVITNAAGGISKNLNPGDIMIIEDHISSFVPSPLIGPNDDNKGDRFPDMSCVYDKAYVVLLKDIMKKLDISVKSGVYLQTTGPQYETPVEIRMFEKLGADAVGMSTVCEAIVARYRNIRVAALSTICNKAAGLGDTLDHKDILLMSDKMSEKIIKILKEFLNSI